MKNAIILHGRPSKDDYYDTATESQSNSHWLPWLQHQLLLKEVLAQTPELPHSYAPDYAEWRKIFEALQPTTETILVGHSYGAGFLIRWLTENSNKKVGRVVLVAPSLGYKFDDRDKFFNFVINPNLAKQTGGITIVVAKNDTESIQRAVKELTSIVKNIKLRELETGGHFTRSDMGKAEFPELLEEVTS